MTEDQVSILTIALTVSGVMGFIGGLLRPAQHKSRRHEFFTEAPDVGVLKQPASSRLSARAIRLGVIHEPQKLLSDFSVRLIPSRFSDSSCDVSDDGAD